MRQVAIPTAELHGDPQFQMPLAQWAVLQGRTYWAASYRLADDVDQRTVDWAEVPKAGMRELRLYVPSGHVAALGDLPEASGRLFHFGCGLLLQGIGRFRQATVIGCLARGSDDRCICYAWEWLPDGNGRLLGPFQDAFHRMAYTPPGGFPVGALNAAVLGVTSDR